MVLSAMCTPRCSTSFPCMKSDLRLMKFFPAICLFFISTLSVTGQSRSEEVHAFIDRWHLAATNADTSFFDAIADGGIYIGTDATERWTKKEFIKFARPYFKRGKAWDFKPFDRNVHFSPDGKTAWFSELLKTWMGDCRGSGVLTRTAHGWKINQYHLSVTVPNDLIDSFIKLVDDFNRKNQGK